MSEAVGVPAYRRVAADLRRKIAAGEIAMREAIPSTARLAEAHGVSITVVRAAVAQLRADGLVQGQPGKGVFVCATPDEVAKRAVSVGELAERVEELGAEVARLREQVHAIEARLAEAVERPGRD